MVLILLPPRVKIQADLVLEHQADPNHRNLMTRSQWLTGFYLARAFSETPLLAAVQPSLWEIEMTRERLLEIYEVEIRQACDVAGDDYDLCLDLIDFTADGAVLLGDDEIMPVGTIDPEQLAGYL
jgi:hypothetical protein